MIEKIETFGLLKQDMQTRYTDQQYTVIARSLQRQTTGNLTQMEGAF